MNIDSRHEILEKKLKFGIFINIIFTIFEFFIGFASGSLALISDASQNLTDSTSLLISFFGLKISKKSPTKNKNFGYGRATIIATLLNGIILLSLGTYIFFQAYERFLNPEPVEGKIVMLIGLLGIIVNSSIAYLFINNLDDINIHSAFVNMIFDALASAGALLAGALIYATNSTLADPVISLIIAVMLLRNSWSVLKTALNILLEGVPHNINYDKVKSEIKIMPGVKDIQNLHIWAISSYSNALTCKIILESSKEQDQITLREIKEKLEKNFNVKHCTIETSTQENNS